MKKIPQTVLVQIRPMVGLMVSRSRTNASGSCHWQNGRVALYAHRLPKNEDGAEMVRVEWYAPAGHADDALSFGAQLLRPTEDKRVIVATMTFAEAKGL